MTLIRERWLYAALWPGFILALLQDGKALDRLEKDVLFHDSETLALDYVHQRHEFSLRTIPVTVGMLAYAVVFAVIMVVF